MYLLTAYAAFAQEADTIQVSPDTNVVKIDSVFITEDTLFEKTGIELSPEDSVVLKKELSDQSNPRKAAIYSAILPGWGQAYNQKYWKIPIIYAGFGVFAYFIDFNHDNYILYKEALQLRTDNNPLTVDEFEGRVSESGLRTRRDFYRRNRDLSIILTVAWYLLNIVDASVDAHLKEFDVSEDLSLNLESENISPNIMSPRSHFSVGFTLKYIIK